MVTKTPLYLTPVQAGFPSPADDFIDTHLDLNEHLIRHPAATFFVRAEGNSMIYAGIQSGDILVVDRALRVDNNAVVVAAVNGELTVKRVRRENERVWLMPENPLFQPIEITEEMEVSVWGVVTHVVHRV
ncbi:translesion error-prone DNA polymerase V autoproteolytic subunit [candidate division WWE3 bacterium]|uniref:Translesion error-prone DNA polymerase V autoproteolytic subunit n=1 Tax=candidate division WWE3 bacterium TaxID=2053526 RepID=A0A955RS99_UNCKA|nr:translesion error-prone DNA polymerase V autoproteolytic subunit [candidate division WWE3 bacterium]